MMACGAEPAKPRRVTARIAAGIIRAVNVCAQRRPSASVYGPNNAGHNSLAVTRRVF